MPRPRNAALRARLIEAATDAFAEHGYAGATLDDIGARAGVTKGGVYFHFHGKEALFYAVLDHWRQLRRRRLQVPAVGSDGAAAALRTFLVGYLEFHFEAPAATHLLRVLATELRSRLTSRLRADERQELRWLRASLRDLLGQGMRDGTLFVEDPAFAAFQLAASVTGVLEQWQTSGAEVKAFCAAEPLAASLVARWQTQSRPPDPAGGAPEFDFRGGRSG